MFSSKAWDPLPSAFWLLAEFSSLQLYICSSQLLEAVLLQVWVSKQFGKQHLVLQGHQDSVSLEEGPKHHVKSFYLNKSVLWKNSSSCVFLLCSYTTITECFPDTSWMSRNLTQFWHCLSEGGIRFKRLRAQPLRTTLAPTSDASWESRMSSVLLTHWL